MLQPSSAGRRGDVRCDPVWVDLFPSTLWQRIPYHPLAKYAARISSNALIRKRSTHILRMSAFVSPLGRHLSFRDGLVAPRPRCRQCPRVTTMCEDSSTSTTPPTQDAGMSPVEVSALAAAAATMILKRASEGSGNRRPPASTVANALLQLEREQRRNRAVTDVSQLAGQWRLTVTANPTSANVLSRPMYFPVRAHQTFIPGEGGPETGLFDNGLFVLGSQMRFRGPYRWVGGSANRLEFTFSSLSIKIGPFGPFVFDGIDKEGSELGTRTAKHLPFFTFYLARNGIAAARGRSGGIALYTRVAPGEEI